MSNHYLQSAVNSFIGILLGSMIYSSLLQYSDTGSIDFYALVLNPKHWFIATFVGVGVFILKKIKEIRSREGDSS